MTPGDVVVLRALSAEGDAIIAERGSRWLLREVDRSVLSRNLGALVASPDSSESIWLGNYAGALEIAWWSTPADLWPDDLAAAVEVFREQPMADVWSRYPAVSELENDATDEVACQTMSDWFAGTMPGALVVVGSASPFPLVGEHVWVTLSYAGWNVDWTARQFHNLHDPAWEAHADLPCPLVWRGGHPRSAHPVGRFGRVRLC